MKLTVGQLVNWYRWTTSMAHQHPQIIPAIIKKIMPSGRVEIEARLQDGSRIERYVMLDNIRAMRNL